MEHKDKKEKYDLYTEHIVPDNTEATKKIIKKVVFTCLFGALFGVIAGFVMLIIVSNGLEENSRPPITLNNQNNGNSGENVTIGVPEDTQPTEPLPEWDEELLLQIEQLNNSYAAIKAIASKVAGYTVTVYKTSDINQGNSYNNTNEAFGLVVAADEQYYYILTDKTFVNGSKCYVKYTDGISAIAEFIKADETTNFAIVKTSKEGINTEVAILGSSAAVREGDMVIAIGELYGFVNSMGCGLVTGSNVNVSDTDSQFELITTDIVGSANSFGVIANLNGAVTGIVTTNYNTGTSNHVAAYAIDDVAGIIEKLMNGQRCSYFGVRGQASKEALVNDKDAPEGIYISSVEINSPAYFAGVQPGDIITSIDNTKMTTMDEFMNALYNEDEGSTVQIKAKRKGREQYKEIVFTVTLGVE